jgi:hypothetical protein
MKTAVDRKSRETIPLIPTTVQYSAIMCLHSDKLVVVNFFFKCNNQLTTPACAHACLTAGKWSSYVEHCEVQPNFV